MSAVESFRALHRARDPLVLVNCWDAASAAAVAAAGAPAVATSSWAVAAAAGEQDGEQLGLSATLETARRLVAAVEVPVSVDLERGYADSLPELAESVRATVATGVAGINIEDGLAEGGVREAAGQGERIATVVGAAGGELVVNARTDLFLLAEPGQHATLLEEAVDRGRAYADAGAECFFVPGLVDPDLVVQVVAAVSIPVNVMVSTPEQARALAAAGARRISVGPAAFLAAMAGVTGAARGWLASVVPVSSTSGGRRPERT